MHAGVVSPRHWRVAAENKRRKPPSPHGRRPARRAVETVCRAEPSAPPENTSAGEFSVFFLGGFQKLTVHVIRNRLAFGSESVKRNSNRTRRPTEEGIIGSPRPPGNFVVIHDRKQTAGLSHKGVPVGAMTHSSLPHGPTWVDCYLFLVFSQFFWKVFR